MRALAHTHSSPSSSCLLFWAKSWEMYAATMHGISSKAAFLLSLRTSWWPSAVASRLSRRCPTILLNSLYLAVAVVATLKPLMWLTSSVVSLSASAVSIAAALQINAARS